VGERGVGFAHSLKEGRGSSSCCYVGKHHDLVVDARFDWKPVDCAKEGVDMRELGKVENQAGCSILDKLQGFHGTSREPSQQRFLLVKNGDDKCLD
jgi:hypothetical protein